MKTVCRHVYSKYPDFDLTHKKEFIKTTVKSVSSSCSYNYSSLGEIRFNHECVCLFPVSTVDFNINRSDDQQIV